MHIEEYTFGRVSVAGEAYTSDVIIFGNRVRDAWWRRQGHALHIEDLTEVMAANPETVVIGTGYYGKMQVPPETRRYLEGRGVTLRAHPTGEAIALFNRLQQECANVVAALHLTC